MTEAHEQYNEQKKIDMLRYSTWMWNIKKWKFIESEWHVEDCRVKMRRECRRRNWATVAILHLSNYSDIKYGKFQYWLGYRRIQNRMAKENRLKLSTF